MTRHAADLVDAAGVGLMLADLQGKLHFVAASQEAAEMLELFQLQNSEGPCLEAFTSGAPVASEDLARATDRWPKFAVRAAAVGFGTVHALPMRLRDTVIGALNIFTAAERHLDASELAVLRALADVATIGLLQERAIRRAALLAEQLEKALTSRIIIEQAKGAIAQARNITPDVAFEMLRSHARRNHLKLTDLAQICVDEPGRIPQLIPDR